MYDMGGPEAANFSGFGGGGGNPFNEDIFREFVDLRDIFEQDGPDMMMVQQVSSCP